VVVNAKIEYLHTNGYLNKALFRSRNIMKMILASDC